MEAVQVRELAERLGAELVETHISWVLLCGSDVYKIKRPVKFSFLDFSTLERRKFFCEEEVRLNRRLSPDVYLGVVPIRIRGGMPEIGGKGRAADYAVRMRKLDRAMMMDALLAAGKVGAGDVKEIARTVAAFHRKADIAGGEFGSSAIVGAQIADLANHRDAIESACRLGPWVDGILSRSAQFMRKNEGVFRKRMASGMVRDCHGDLHARNVFLLGKKDGGARIVDCIEFNQDFRCIDVASDVAFMAMDLDYCGREDLSQEFVDAYVSETHDAELETVLPLYKCYRANVRAKVAAIEWSANGKEDERQRIDRYVLLASKYAKVL
jgi:uncharacterized protein